jgi:NAD(P)-dependent dehydrogenase (short-subunit alcohol dehydrogenase family)
MVDEHACDRPGSRESQEGEMSMYEGRVAIITGGTGALGRAVVQVFVHDGARVAVPYRGERDLQVLRQDLGDRVDRLLAVSADMTDGAAMSDFVTGVVETLGRLDVLVNVIGGFAGGKPLQETDEATWDRMHNLNLRSVYLACHAAVPHLLQAGRGAIVNVSSRPALVPTPNLSAYAVAKAGVLTLTTTLAAELKPHGITVNAVVPGTIDTPANREGARPEQSERWTKPAEIARVIHWLCGDDAAIVSGAAIPVYGKS